MIVIGYNNYDLVYSSIHNTNIINVRVEYNRNSDKPC